MPSIQQYVLFFRTVFIQGWVNILFCNNVFLMQRIAGEIKSFSTDGWVAPKLSKRLDRFMLFMLTAGKKALVDGGITDDVMDELDKRRCGVLIGSALGGMRIFSDAIEALRVSYKKMNPFCVPFATTNMGSAILSMDLGWMGPNYSISTACATSNFCILNAANHTSSEVKLKCRW
nr:3-oxoacyl-[acyl-carrier-protein] synthase II, chloroplastic-like [Ipomoea batatas]